jgi:formylglycine-generating enzyme required for sulfatase activity
LLLALGSLPVCGQLLLSDSYDVTGGNSPGTGFGADGPTAGVNYQIASRLSGTAAAGLRYVKTATTKAASSYAILNNQVHVAVATNSGRFSFTADGATPFDLGPALGVTRATALEPVSYELAVKFANHSPGTLRSSFGLATADDGVQNWSLGLQLVNNGANLDIYRRVDASCNSSGTDYNDVIATLAGKAGTEVDLRVRITDAGAESSTGKYNSKYEVFANGNLVFTSATGSFRFANSAARVVLFDTAGSAGPVTYDAFSLTLLTSTNPPVVTNIPLRILSHRLAANGFELTWSSQPNTNYSVLKCTNLSAPHWVLATNLTAAGTNTTTVDAAARTTACYYCVAQLAQPGLTLANVSARQRTGSAAVDIYYDLSDLYAGTASISVLVSTDGGLTYHAAAASFTGDVGAGVDPGAGRHIVWNVGADWSSLSASNVRVKIVADRAPAGADMGLVPSGAFNMGNAKSEGLDCESPVHALNVSAFYAGRYEVTKGLWDQIAQWATNHGYTFQSPAVGSFSNLPVQQVSWYDAVKWCNARSEQAGLPPAYYLDRAWTTVYRTGEVDLAEGSVRWQGAGYRLPTEAEWEKAARGGLDGQRFPWGDTITQSQANYWSTTFESFDVTGTSGPHPLAPQFPNMLPVGSFQPSGYGLYDMAGNIWEWCWDYYGDTWYSVAQATSTDTHGPSVASWGGDRVYRGGSGVDNAWKSRVANRADAPPRFAMGHFGFRVVLPAGLALTVAESPVFTITP